MTMLTAPIQSAFTRPHAAMGVVHRAWRAFIRALAIRQLRQGLRAMPDWLLHDIGVGRAEIDAVAVQLVDERDHLSLCSRVYAGAGARRP
jgi:uncharacterized protein YjiS (DUF1127 family)